MHDQAPRVRTTIDWDDLEAAYTIRMPETSYYFDEQSGTCEMISRMTFDSEEEYHERCEELFGDARYHGVDQIESHESWELMQDFADSLSDAALSDRLHDAIRGRGAFRRFKDEVHRAGIAERWYAYEKRRHLALLVRWLDSIGVQPTNPPTLADEQQQEDPRAALCEASAATLEDAAAELRLLAAALRAGESPTSRTDEIAANLRTLAHELARETRDGPR